VSGRQVETPYWDFLKIRGFVNAELIGWYERLNGRCSR